MGPHEGARRNSCPARRAVTLHSVAIPNHPAERHGARRARLFEGPNRDHRMVKPVRIFVQEHPYNKQAPTLVIPEFALANIRDDKKGAPHSSRQSGAQRFP